MTAQNDIISQPETRLVTLSNHLTVKKHHTKRFLSSFFTKIKKHPKTDKSSHQEALLTVKKRHTKRFLSLLFTKHKKHPKTDTFSHQEALLSVKKHHRKRFLSSFFTTSKKHPKNDKSSHQEALLAVKKHHTKRFLSLFFTITLLTPTLHAAQLLDSQNTVHNIRLMRSDAEKARGLMYRLYLAPSQGMLFHFDPPQNARFWMYHTYIPLAISFYDAYGRLLTHYPHATPCYHPNPAHCPIYPAHGQVKYVLETRPAQRNIRPPYALPEPPAQLTHLQ